MPDVLAVPAVVTAQPVVEVRSLKSDVVPFIPAWAVIVHPLVLKPPYTMLTTPFPLFSLRWIWKL
jgi:hypothetical protein